MGRVLLVEPDYASKFPPLGLMRLATYHRDVRKDSVVFARGKQAKYRDMLWDRVYVSSLFTYELPRTVATAQYYLSAVADSRDIIVGGIGAILMPDYIASRVGCRVISTPLDRAGLLDPDAPAISALVPDYAIADSASDYRPRDSYFCRVTTGCIRKCGFCAVPRLEPEFAYLQSLRDQVADVDRLYGERQHLVLLDNNILALREALESVIGEIRDAGFEARAVRNRQKRTVDFNQGIDARLITPQTARLLSTICLSPVRLAFDNDTIEPAYKRAVRYLADAGFIEFTNYVMFNFDDSPQSLHRRLKVNTELSAELGVRVTGFPMRYAPTDSVTRRYVAPDWHWRYIRGIQCILNATHGMVSPNPEFFKVSFGDSAEEFMEIAAMPDRYIIQRKQYRDHEAAEWRALFRSLSTSERAEFLDALQDVHFSKNRVQELARYGRYADLLEHYYPGRGRNQAGQMTLPDLALAVA